MAGQAIDYSTFEPDWWDGAGVSAEAVKNGIASVIKNSYGGSITQATEKALVEAAYQNYLAQNALKASAAAAKDALQYADLPESALYKNAVATSKAYDAVAKSALNQASQIMTNANANSALASGLTKLASALGPAINIAQLGVAANTGDAYEVGKTAVTVLAGMAVGALVSGALAAAGVGAVTAGVFSIMLGFAASKVWGWAWDNGGADAYGIHRGDEFSFGKFGKDLTSLLSSLFDQAKSTISPLILDLDGDGVETIGVSAGIHFDHDGNGTAETTGWVGKDDGLLVWDRNGNGKIDDGTELFGNYSLLSNGQRATNGFSALAELDSNHDGKIDSNDTAFSSLQVWRDINSDAKVDAGELISLSETNVSSLNTAYKNGTATDAQGNKALQVGQYTDANGVVRGMNDIWFSVDLTNTVDAAPVAISGEIAGLPDFSGLGNVRSLHQALMSDTSGVLVSLVKQLKEDVYSASSSGLIDQLIYRWSGADTHAPNSRGEYFSDARKLYALEAFLAKSFIQGAGANEGLPDPGPNSAEVLVNAYEKLRSYILDSLILDVRMKPYFQAIKLDASSTGGVLNFGAVTSTFEQAFSGASGTSRALVVIDLLKFRDYPEIRGVFLTSDLMDSFIGRLSSLERSDVLARMPDLRLGFSGDDRLVGANDKNYLLIGGAGNDELVGGSLHDRLEGGAGNDTLTGGAGNDVLDGGTGNDVLNGGSGADTYLFSLGSGRDTISDDNGYISDTDVLKFGAGILASDLIVSRVGINLVVSHRNGQDQVTINNWFAAASDRYQIERFEFADGTVWTSTALSNALLNQVGGDGDDVLTGVGAAFKQWLSGGGGNDTLTGGGGADVLDGGTGNDVLNGGAGGDTYLFNLGDGRDTISDDNGYVPDTDVLKFGAGIVASDLIVSRVGINLVVSHRNGQDQVTINNWFAAASDRYQIERFEFADGTVWTSTALSNALLNQVGGDGDDVLAGVGAAFKQWLSGGGGNDTLTGGGGADVLDGGTGNDVLNGGAGGDTYLFNLGDGRDTINDDNGYISDTDVLKFGAGILASDLIVSRVGINLVVSHRNGQDQVTINNWFATASDRYQIERFEFSDGTVWTSTALSNALLNQVGGDGDDVLAGVGAAFKQWLSGGGGNDTLTGGGGADVLDGGKGNDILNGGAGSDTYLFKLGDGRDTINDDNGYVSGTDILKFGAGILAADLSVSRSGVNLVVSHRNGQDQVTINNWFVANSDRYQIERFEFVDGTVWTSAAISTLLLQLQGGDGDDVLTGVASSQPQFIRGGGGNDVITAGAGADLLEGGTGNDILNGGAGGDTYLFNLGDGRDIINDDNGYGSGTDVLRFGEGILAADLITSRVGNNLVVSHRNGQDQVTINNWFAAASDRYQIERFEFADGTVWTSASLSNALLNQIGGDGDDMLTGVGAAFNQWLSGGAGNDTLTGGSGVDVLDGGIGNDVLNGGAGSDIYLFKLGDGRDTINDDNGYGSGTDVLKFAAGILATDLSVSRVGAHLVVSHRNGQDQVTINNWFAAASDRYQIERFEFADGTVWTSATLSNALLNQVGSDGDDVLTGVGAAFNQWLSGGAGNDTLTGGSGVDVLDGGTGNDVLNGGAGSDTYLFKLGDGRDTINDDNGYGSGTDVLKFAAGILATDLSVSRVGAHLVVSHRNGQDQVTINNWFAAASDRYQIERFEFADGTVWTSATLSNALLNQVGSDGDDVLTGVGAAFNQWLSGGAGNDTLTGGSGVDVLDGGTGNDVLNGGAGSDTYLFKLGDGRDTINDDNGYGSGTDVLKFAAGILATDLSVTRVGAHLVVSHRNGQDQVTINNWFAAASDRYQIERFEFADGTVWTSASLSNALLNQIGGDGDDVLTGVNAAFNQWLSGGAGNDILTGGSGADVLDGGTGNDVLNGGAGSDTYLFKLGDGRDTINDDNGYGSGTDVLKFGEGILTSDLTASRVGNSLVVSHKNGADQLTISNWFYATDGRYRIERFEFADGSLLTSDQMTARSSTAGNDTITGAVTNDRLQGGKGNDLLQGAGGSDTYIFAAGDGQDVINNFSTTPGDADTLVIQGIAATSLWLSRDGNNLVIDVTGSDDRVTVKDWYLGAAQKIDVIQAGTGALYANAVDNLVNAMASFGAPAGGEIALTNDQREQLNAVIAANWH